MAWYRSVSGAASSSQRKCLAHLTFPFHWYQVTSGPAAQGSHLPSLKLLGQCGAPDMKQLVLVRGTSTFKNSPEMYVLKTDRVEKAHFPACGKFHQKLV